MSGPLRPQTRQFLKTAAAGAALLALSPARAQGLPKEGVEYRVVQPTQPTDSGGKLEVLEFFWYGCPHCFSLEPTLREWSRKLPADVSFRKVHVALGPAWEPHQQLYYTLEALGKNATLDEKVFTAIHVDRVSLDKPDRMADFLARQGVDRKAFLDTYESFAVRTRKQKAMQQARAWGLDGVPGLAVNGKYFTSPSMARGNAQALQVVEYLLDLERKARK
ncbi:MAG TPA: thiol:disulfide interchange protein DsbA/DsbL [Burkholderiaceae bacterium]|mgnify:CR=1 FL=1|nr:thiol:disulfide interchange protein DsbA/DsbL [Burkholderiaceae bacterium]